MRRRSVWRCAATVASAVAVVSLSAGPAFAGHEDDGLSRLPSGHCLTTTHKLPGVNLQSRSAQFDLYLGYGQLILQQNLQLPHRNGEGAESWERPDGLGRGPRGALCMLPNGNLALRGPGGAVRWTSHSRGKGTGDFAELRNNGQLVITDGQGAIAWSSGTTAIMLKRGMRLRSSQVLRNHPTANSSLTTLEMTKSGDLVLALDHRQVWHTDTHTRGSELHMTPSGRAVVRAPNGDAKWRSRAYGRSVLLILASRGRLVMEDARHPNHCWMRPVQSDKQCDSL